jgi:chemotaxis protein methyltransferase CheR
MIFGFRQFSLMQDLIYDRTGIRVAEVKIHSIKRHVESRIKVLGLPGFEDYYRRLRFFDPEGEEFQGLVSEITVNETYFFRDFSQLRAFAEECLEELMGHKTNRGPRSLKILSAGCSTGEEPYTLAIILREMVENLEAWSCRILACDIDEAALDRAREGFYDARSVKDVPAPYLARWFAREGDHYRVDPSVLGAVTFYQVNLFDEASMAVLGEGFDFVFCRNVLIYFDEASRRAVVERFYRMMDPGGYIFLGHSEAMSRISSAFELVKTSEHMVYRKPRR